jgi:putative transcriptional regulator
MIEVNLDAVCKSKGKSRYWLWQTTGISQSALSNLANNKTGGIDFELLYKICIALECEPGDILKIARN